MHASPPTATLAAVALLLLGSPLLAHGGIYRGPAAPQGPRIGPHGPITSTPAQQNPTASNETATAQFAEDITTWQYWWEFNKHAYLDLRTAVHGVGPITSTDTHGWRAPQQRLQLAPTKAEIEKALPALKRAIDSTEQRDTVTSCLIALAKIGQDHKDFALIDVFTPRLRIQDQEIRETAALAMGISAVASEQALEHLLDLSLDSDAGRELSGGYLTMRTRVFALYGLGLYSNQHRDPTIQRRALDAMRSTLEGRQEKGASERDLKVAAIHGMGLLSFDRASAEGLAMLDEALDSLHRFYVMPASRGTQLIQAHCPAAICKLLGSDHPRRDAFRKLFASELEAKQPRDHDLLRSAALALGQLCGAYENDNSPDKSYSELLAATAEDHKDNQTRFFSLLALGQIGGEQNQRFLLRELEAANKREGRPWAAIALGVQAFALHQAEGHEDLSLDARTRIGEALTRQLQKARLPELVGALGVALGLTRHSEAAKLMRQRVTANLQQEQQAGYLCMGLAMMSDLKSLDAIEAAVKASSRRPWLFVQASSALGLLGNKSASAQVRQLLDDGDSVVLSRYAAAAIALGEIGDRRAITPLKHYLHNDELTDLQRAFAAASLGCVLDRAKLPWHSKISTNFNYRASVETLTNRYSGILDIL